MASDAQDAEGCGLQAATAGGRGERYTRQPEMRSASATQAGISGRSDRFIRLGGWLFQHRTLLPLPLVVLFLLAPPESSAPWLFPAGLGLVTAGELLRLWAVRHIGTVSRTRSTRLGPLIDTGPFARVRNPLYLGNIGLWTGFALSARLPWLTPVILFALILEYSAIVRWEERLLESRAGDAYRAYSTRVPRWIPSMRRDHAEGTRAPFSWSGTFFSERGTLMAIAAGYALLWAKST